MKECREKIVEAAGKLFPGQFEKSVRETMQLSEKRSGKIVEGFLKAFEEVMGQASCKAEEDRDDKAGYLLFSCLHSSIFLKKYLIRIDLMGQGFYHDEPLGTSYWDAHLLNKQMIDTLEKYCKEVAVCIETKPFYRWSEEHKQTLSVAANSVTDFAFALAIYYNTTAGQSQTRGQKAEEVADDLGEADSAAERSIGTKVNSATEGGSKTLTTAEAEEYAFNAIRGSNNADAVVLGKLLWSSIFVTLVAKKILDCCRDSIGSDGFRQGCFAPLKRES